MGTGELGVHSVDHFSLNVPDMAEAEHFYQSFGMDVQAESAKLVLRTAANKHAWGVIAEGPRKCLRYLSFGAFEEDVPRFKERIERQGIRLLNPPPGYESNGLWFRDPDQNLIEIKVAEKTSPNQKSAFAMTSVPGGQRGAPGRADVQMVRPNRMCHVLLFTTDVDKAMQFYSNTVGLRLTDRGGDAIAFMHGIHGSDHHMLAFGLAPNPGFHHASWGVETINEVGLGAMQRWRTKATTRDGDFIAPRAGIELFALCARSVGQLFRIHLRHRLHLPKRLRLAGGTSQARGFDLSVGAGAAGGLHRKSGSAGAGIGRSRNIEIDAARSAGMRLRKNGTGQLFSATQTA